MLFFEKIDFQNSDIIEKFLTKRTVHHSTFEHYYNSYNSALRCIFKKGLQQPYPFNTKSRGIMCLLRHSLELCLKFNLELQGIKVPGTHDFTELINTYKDQSIIPAAFHNVVQAIDKDKDGAAYRYYINSATGKRFFSINDSIELAPVIKEYNSIQSANGFIIGNISDPFNYDKNAITWDLTLHMGHCWSLGNVRSEFADTASYLIDAIIKKEITIDDVYLPLLYLVRHSLELALKSNISDVKDLSDKLRSKDFQHEHSLHRLYRFYREYLEGLNIGALDEEIRKQLASFIEGYNKLNDTMHHLDVNSRAFKYPYDKEGKPHANPFDIKSTNIISILQLLYFTNPFLLFTNEVFRENGLH